MKPIISLLLLLTLTPLLHAATPTLPWPAGQILTPQDIQALGGIDACFTHQPIPDNIAHRIPKEGTPHTNLRYLRLLHWDYDQQTRAGEIICNTIIAQRLLHIFRQLYNAHYPIQHILLPDIYNNDDETQMRANNTSSYLYRPIAHTNRLSKHAQGLAIDINPLYNPCCTPPANPNHPPHIQPATATQYTDRTKTFPYKIHHNTLLYQLFIQAGFTWGGDWKNTKDYQHFELKQ